MDEKNLEKFKLFVTFLSKQDLLLASKTDRNKLCPCGSNKKYKKCHLDLIKRELKIRRL